MRVFVPLADDWSNCPDLSRVKLVPYRAGLSICPAELATKPEPGAIRDEPVLDPTTAQAA
jgi:hypothetical protein